jgi:outer membrane protein assembly factor BamB
VIKSPQIVINTIFIGVSLLLIGWWVSHDPSSGFESSKPGMDNRGKGIANAEEINIGEHYETFDVEKAESFDENWPRFRGSDFDNIYKGDIQLIDQFEETPPDTLWSVELGEGHAGPAIYEGMVYLLDYDEEKKADMLRCFNLKSGKEVWRRWYKVNIKRNHGMSRTVPAVTEDYVLTMGPRCHVMCVERESGDFLWGIDIEKEFESEVPLWYTGQCPLIDDGVAVIATGGKSLMIGVDCATGEILWEVPNERGWKMSHSSVMPYTFNGRKMYVYSAIGGVVGVSPEGEMLWSSAAWDHSVVAPAPVCMPDGKIFLTAGYGAGSMMLHLKQSNGEFDVEVLDEYKPSEGLASEQQTPVYYEGHLFGILPKDGGSLRNQMVCVHPDNPKDVVWSSGKTKRFGLGPYLVADDKFYLLNDDGTLFILDANTQEYREMDNVELLSGHDAWAPMAIADGYLVLRDSKTMVCINIEA